MSDHEFEPTEDDEPRELSEEELEDVAGGKGIEYDAGQMSP